MKDRIKARIKDIKASVRLINVEDVITWIIIGAIIAAAIACVAIAVVSCINGEVDTAERGLHLLPNGKGGFNVFVW